MGLTPGLNVDLTYNTDFAQVEVDNQQINLTRFNVRFPEKRPFFLENSGLFNVGASASGAFSTGDLDLFFSRRIGLDDNGNLVPIIGGGRLSGKTNGYNVGFLNMQTDALGVVRGLTRKDFYKSMTTHADHRIWQDAYHGRWNGLAL